MKRVTTVEGRASGRTILVGDTSHGKQSQLTDEKNPEESSKLIGTEGYALARQGQKLDGMKGNGIVCLRRAGKFCE